MLKSNNDARDRGGQTQRELQWKSKEERERLRAMFKLCGTSNSCSRYILTTNKEMVSLLASRQTNSQRGLAKRDQGKLTYKKKKIVYMYILIA